MSQTDLSKPLIYGLCQCEFDHETPTSDWGTFQRFLEIGDDGFAKRQIDVYENGNVLKYSEAHYLDDFGALADAKYDRDQWIKHWGPFEFIDGERFETAWRMPQAQALVDRQQASREELEGFPKAPWRHFYELRQEKKRNSK